MGISDKTVAELRAIAKSRGNIRNYSRMRKAELIATLKRQPDGVDASPTIAQLRKEARLRKVPGYSRMGKASLVRALSKTSAETIAEPATFVPCLMTARDTANINRFFKTHPGVGRFDPNNACKTLQSLFPPNLTCIKGWTFESILGAGRYGLTVGVSSGDKQAAFKVVTTRRGLDEEDEEEDAQDLTSKDPVEEARIQEAFAKAGIAPKILQICTRYSPAVRGRKKHECPEYAMIVMDRILGVAENLLGNLALGAGYENVLAMNKDFWHQCREILTEMARMGYTHGDMNLGNIALNSDPDNDFGPSGFQVLLIDYGLATTKFACTAADVSWFVRNACSPFHMDLAENVFRVWGANYKRLYRDFLVPTSIELFEWAIATTEAELALSGSKLPKALGRQGIAAMRRLRGLYRKYPWSATDASTITTIQKKLAHAYVREI